MFGQEDLLKAAFVLGPIIGLMLVGLVISLRSGVGGVQQGGGLRLLASNLSWILVRIAGYLTGILAVQRLIGLRMDIGW